MKEYKDHYPSLSAKGLRFRLADMQEQQEACLTMRDEAQRKLDVVEAELTRIEETFLARKQKYMKAERERRIAARERGEQP